MNDPDTIFAVIETYDLAAAQELQQGFAVEGMPDILSKALSKHTDDPAFLVENLRLFLAARENGEEATCIAFLANGGPESILKAHDGTPTVEDLSKLLRCEHLRMKPLVCDQTAAVECPDCGLFRACWADKHIPESLWNIACKDQTEWLPASQSRDNYCALCKEEIRETKDGQ